jgi:hypothetical protein
MLREAVEPLLSEPAMQRNACQCRMFVVANHLKLKVVNNSARELFIAATQPLGLSCGQDILNVNLLVSLSCGVGYGMVPSVNDRRAENAMAFDIVTILK